MAYISFQPSAFFNATVYTGTGASNAQTGVGFQPDFTWIKNRDAVDFHVLTDAVRGATKYINSDRTNVEATDINSLTSFDSDGFTVGDMAEVNTNTEDYVSWNWKAGTTTGIAGSPTITPSSYSFDATAGFSVIAYTGTGTAATLPHGLGAIPGMIIVKTLNSALNWDVYHRGTDSTPEDYILVLNSDDAKADNNTAWNDTAPTSTLFSVGNGGDTNVSSNTYIAYCFTSVKGYSEFGSYTGNGSIDGAFVNVGFRPAYVLVKRTNGTGYWQVMDDKRVGYNPTNYLLYPNVTDVGGTESMASLLSNGFKFNTTSYHSNGAGNEYIYAAFAEFPFVSSNSVPTVAR